VNRQNQNDLRIGSYGNSDDAAARAQKRIEARERLKKEDEKLRVQDCKQYYDSKISKIEKRLKSKYSISLGESLRDRRRNLVKRRKTECR